MKGLDGATYNLKTFDETKSSVRIKAFFGEKGVSLVTMTDTGASVNLMNKETYNRDMLNDPNFVTKHPVRQYDGPMPISASNLEIKVTHFVIIDVQIGTINRPTPFLLCPELSDQCIMGRLGMDMYGPLLYVPKE